MSIIALQAEQQSLVNILEPMGFRAVGNAIQGDSLIDLNLSYAITDKSRFDVEMDRVALVSIAQGQGWDLISWEKRSPDLAAITLRFELQDRDGA